MRAAVATAGLAVVVVIPDCELMPEQLIGLFGMFPKCAFLLNVYAPDAVPRRRRA